MSLAFGPRRHAASLLYAGVNSSPADLAKGVNRHLRTLSLAPSSSKASEASPDATISELSSTPLFVKPDRDTYQRLLRLAGSLGAAASAMSKDPQIAIFDTSAAKPAPRGVLELPRDAEDLDLIQISDQQYQLAFCYKTELHLLDIASNLSSDPTLVFSISDDEPRRPSFRSIRYLNSRFLLAVANLPSRRGFLLQAYRLPSPGHETARLAATARVTSPVAATSLALVSLAPPSSSESQFVIAVAAHDSSIFLYTLEHKTSAALEYLANLHPLYTIRPAFGSENITGLAFSPFHPPADALERPSVQLASVSLQQKVTVYSIPLRRLDPVASPPGAKAAASKPARYVTAMRSRPPSHRSLVLALTFIVLILAIVGQGVMEVYGQSRPFLFSHPLSPNWHGKLAFPDVPSAANFQKLLVSKLARDLAPASAGQTMLLRRALPRTGQGEPSAPGIELSLHDPSVHDPSVHGPARSWHELGPDEQTAWRERLAEAGAWTQTMGESVFKGILFGELAAAVGRAVEA